VKKQTTGNLEIGNFLREKRWAAEKSQGDVSKEFGYASPQFVSNWERGISHPPHAEIRELAKFYNCNPEEFCEQYLQIMLRAYEKEMRKELMPKRKAQEKKAA